MNRYRLTGVARQAILEIWLKMAAESERSADAYVDRLVRHFRLLADYPGSGRRREELGSGYRSVSVDEYVVFYRLVRSQVLLMQVVHRSRDSAFSVR
ncbi:MAG TPA: type II toxin-antitoxin system RelE/ParE family toxin [Bryobacteraceae bacterium]|nr:type II toxin-antitoxin system RelE/ParE family toxin [Bryobacteraceae bacterium]